jgi:hypothetical protein
VKIRGWGNENINIKNKSVDKINTESSLAIAQKLSSLWPIGSHRRLCREGKVVLTMSEEVGTIDVGGIVTAGTNDV